MGKMIAYTHGQTVGQATYLHDVERKSRLNRRAAFRCMCGATFESNIANVAYGSVNSCGCLKVNATVARSTKHGHSKQGYATRLYRFWQSMKDRTTNPRSVSFKYYGGRGIAMEEDWKDNFPVFREWFVAEFGMPDVPKGMSMDRIDGNRGYVRGNLRIADAVVQANNRSFVLKFQFRGKEVTITDLANLSGIKRGTLRSRLTIQNLTPEEAIKNKP